MLLNFSLLIACCHHHHHHANCNPISTIRSFEEVDFDQIDENALVVFTNKLPQSVIRELNKRGVNVYVFTSQNDLKNYLNQPGSHFNKIIFFDDKEKNMISVAKAAEDLGIAYKGYIYKDF